MSQSVAASVAQARGRRRVAVPLCPERGLRTVGHAELFEDPGEVSLDGPFGDAETTGDELVGQQLRAQRAPSRSLDARLIANLDG